MYPIFQIKDSKKNTIERIIKILIITCIIAMISLFIIALIPSLFRYKDLILEQTFTLNMIIISLVVINIIHFVFFKDKNKKTPCGYMSLHENHISIQNQKIPLNEIEKIRIIGNDIKGEFRVSIGNGQRNTIHIALKNGQKINYNFLQTTKQRLKEDKHLEKLFEQQLISKSNYQSILNNTNYY